MLKKAILPFPAGVGVGVVPASTDPVIGENVTARAQANLMTRETGEFREVIIAYMGTGLSLPHEHTHFREALTDVIAGHEAPASPIIRS
jgi:metallophosphoesterase superfamily enzyme